MLDITKNKLKYFLNILFIYFFILSIYLTNINIYCIKKTKKNRIAIIGYHNDNNIGNQLIKYAMNLFLKKNGFNPTLISFNELKNINIDFLKKYLVIKEINNYSTDINEGDFDCLLVNSDQVWASNYKQILEVGFLSFAKNWNIPKIVYGASLAYEYWVSSKDIINSAKKLIKQFSGVSVREINSVELIKNYLGIKPIFVLDPTFLISKFDYLEIIKDFKLDIDINKNYLVSYILDKSSIKESYINKIHGELKFEIISIEVGTKNFIEKFIFLINICKSIITDSYHGTVFSIIFNKPFITFINSKRGNIRFFSLNQTFKLSNRFINPIETKKIDLETLTKSPNINLVNFNSLKEKSIKFLKDNLDFGIKSKKRK